MNLDIILEPNRVLLLSDSKDDEEAGDTVYMSLHDEVGRSFIGMSECETFALWESLGILLQKMSGYKYANDDDLHSELMVKYESKSTES